MTRVKLRKWDSAEHLKTDEDMAAYLEACLEEAGRCTDREPLAT